MDVRSELKREDGKAFCSVARCKAVSFDRMKKIHHITDMPTGAALGVPTEETVDADAPPME